MYLVNDMIQNVQPLKNKSMLPIYCIPYYINLCNPNIVDISCALITFNWVHSFWILNVKRRQPYLGNNGYLLIHFRVRIWKAIVIEWLNLMHGRRILDFNWVSEGPKLRSSKIEHSTLLAERVHLEHALTLPELICHNNWFWIIPIVYKSIEFSESNIKGLLIKAECQISSMIAINLHTVILSIYRVEFISLSFAFANLTSISKSPLLLFIFLSIIFIFLSADIISAITCRCIWWISWISLRFRSLFSSFWLVKSVKSSLIRCSLSNTFDLFEIFTSSPPISLKGFQIGSYMI